ncbi:MAG: pentapeptide repeat-containing protein [Chitinophagales bacterium]|nr:pentapeptide repeat-containing protein [Chitinophagales bacterium]
MKKISHAEFEKMTLIHSEEFVQLVEDIHLVNAIYTDTTVQRGIAHLRDSIIENTIFIDVWGFWKIGMVNVKFINCLFVNVRFDEFYFTYCEFVNTIFNKCEFKETSFSGCKIEQMVFNENYNNIYHKTYFDECTFNKSVFEIDKNCELKDTTFENSITIIDGQLTKY